MSTLERLWLGWCGAVVAVALAADGGGGVGHLPVRFVALQLAVAALQLVPPWLQRTRGIGAARTARAAIALVGLPIVFSSLAWLLPHVLPEPFELTWLGVDRRLFGGDATASLRASVPHWCLLPLQVVYASFYFVPIAAALAAGRCAGARAFDRALTILAGGFLCSYLGYLLWPTLAPKQVLPLRGDELDGLARSLHVLIDAGEANPWDCFPSGHTMLSITSVIVVWRWARRLLPLFVLVVTPLVVSTMVLRYHWPIDVAVGALLAWPTTRAIDWLMDRDAIPAA